VYIDLGNNGTIDDSLLLTNRPLPVQLASFTASLDTLSRVVLNWLTLSETNNYGFYIQKKRQGETAWTEIPNSFIPGHGTTFEPHRYTFTDASTLPGRWHYRLRQVDLDGTTHFSEPVTISTITSVGTNSIPGEYSLHQNYPNPFNPVTQIKFDLAEPSQVQLIVYDVLGRQVAELANDNLNAGYHSTSWNASDVASGVYFARLTARDVNGATKLNRVIKLMLMR
jgi:hypothetical protein